MSGHPAHPTIDTHVLLRADDKILLSQRGGPYGYRRWHLPSGKLDQGEPLTVGAARELFEETDVKADPDRLELLHVVHHRQEDGSDRIGFFFLATEWEGTPRNKEPEKCLALQWFADHDLPEDIIEYPEAGLHGCLNQTGALTLHGWQ